VRRPSLTRLRILGLIAFFVALGSWAVASPVGASPDEDFHLVSTWCAHGLREGVCEAGTSDQTRMVPGYLTGQECYAFKSLQSAACQFDRGRQTALVESSRGNFDGLYPEVFFWVNGWFVSDDISGSVIAMRLFNALLYLGFFAAVFIAVPAGLRRAMVGAALVTSVPLGMFIIPSLNPSSWGMLAAATVMVCVLGYLTARTRRQQIQCAVLAALALLIGAGARADAAMFAIIAIGAAVIMTLRWNKEYAKRLIVPGVLVALAIPAYLLPGQSSHADLNASTGAFELRHLLSIMVDLPSLWIGGLGTWGLGWLDTGMPPLVWVSTWSVFVGVLLLAITGRRGQHAIAIALMAAAVVAIPAYVQYLSGYLVGSVIQPRYILPLLTILGVVALVRVRGTAFRLTNGQRWFVVVLLAAANAVALHANLRRYITGTDVTSYDLDRDAEWWWMTFVSPMALWIVGSLAFLAGAALVTREFTTVVDAAEPGTPPAATIEPLMTEVPDLPVQDGKRSMVGAALSRLRLRPRAGEALQ
jgi:predicted membrane protein DUF2142